MIKNQPTTLRLISRRESRIGPLGKAWLALRQAYAAVLSAWVITALVATALAWLLDQALQSTFHGAAGGATALTNARALTWIAALGLSPIVSVIGLLVAFWLLRRGCARASITIAATSMAVLVFSARPFSAVDLIGWREALFETAAIGRTIGSTAIGIVLGVVLYRERLIRRPTLAALGIGFPAAVGLSRVALGAYPLWAIVAQWLVGAVIAGGFVWTYLSEVGPF